MKIITKTKRLIIREIGLSDIDVMLELPSDPEVHLYLGGKTITDRNELLDRIHLLQEEYKDYGVGRWAMIHKDTKEFIGWTGLEYVTKEINQHKDFYDLGYRLLKEFWGQGYATESALASLQYIFNELNANVVYAMADIANASSNKVLNKVGLKYITEFDHEGVKHNWYKLERFEFSNSISDV